MSCGRATICLLSAVALSVALAACGGAGARGPVRIFAAPGASSDASCSAAHPCSLSAAVAAERAAVRRSVDVILYLHGGTYRLADTIRLGAADSGRAGHRVIWRNYPGEAPVLSGGVPLRGWRRTSNGLWSTGAQGLNFLQLYDADRRFTRPRSDTALGELYRVAGTDTIQVRVPDAMLGNWNLSHVRRAQVVVQYTFRQLRYPIASISADKDGYRWITTQKPAGSVIVPSALAKTGHVRRDIGTYNVTRRTYALRILGGESSFPTYLENAPELIHREGDWYLDRHADRVKLRLTQDPNRLRIVAPRLQNLLVVDGAANLLFYGLEFAHSTWTRPAASGSLTRQGGARFAAVPAAITGRGYPVWYVNPGAVVVRRSRHVSFLRDRWRFIGATGIVLGPGTRNVSIRESVFDQIAGTGIFLGSAQQPEAVPADRNVDSVVTGNLFRTLGQDYSAGSAVNATYPSGLVVAHNEIDDVPNIGIDVGWVNNIAPVLPTVMQDVRVDDNLIKRACTVAYDCAGIHVKTKFPYGSGIPRSEIAGNVIESVNRPSRRSLAAIAAARSYRPLAAIYLDNYAGGLLVARNTWRMCQRGIARNHAGSGNTLVANRATPSAVVGTAGLPATGPDLKRIVATGASIGGTAGPYPLPR